MKAAIAVVLVVIAVAVVALALYYFPAAPSPTRAKAGTGRPAPRFQSAPTEVVAAYLQDLESKDYRHAYDTLSAASRRVHPYDDFVSRAEKAGLPDYDSAKAREEPESANVVTVVLPLREDPATAGFHLVKEEGAWKVVFIGGVPAFPYAEAR